MNENFYAYSQYYDLLYKDKNYSAETEYVCQLIEKYSASKKDILDLGSGTGKHANLFAEKGYRVYGVERSKEMVNVARSNSKVGVEFEVGDISKFTLNKDFDVVVSLFHVISYLTTNEQLIDTFKLVHGHLRDNGIFIFDVWYTPAVYHQKPETRVKRLVSDEVNIIRIAESSSDFRRNVVNVSYEVLVNRRDDQTYSSLHETHPMRHFSEPEIFLFALMTGFQVLHAEEFLTSKIPGTDTWGVCFVLQKV